MSNTSTHRRNTTPRQNTPNKSRRNSHPALTRISQDSTNYPPPSGPQDINSHCWRLASCVLIVKPQTTQPNSQPNNLPNTEPEYLTVQTRKRPTENDLPGGKVEPGETYPNAAIRELKEETNLTTTENDLILLHEGSDGGELLDPPKPPFWVKTYLCTNYEGTEMPGPEELSVSWRPLSELKVHSNPVWREYHTQVYNKYQEYLQNHLPTHND